jgi:hypothetical protein
VLRIRDVYPGATFFHPGYKSKNLSILTQKIVFQALGITIPVVHPGSGSCFFTHPVSRGQKGTGSRIHHTGLIVSDHQDINKIKNISVFLLITV